MNNLKNKIETLFKYKYTYEIYCLILCILSVITWWLLPNAGMIILILLGSIILFITNDFKTILPLCTNIVFTIGSNFTSNKIPYGVIIAAIIFALTLIIYLIRNKHKFYKGKLFYPFLGLAVLNIISIFWTAIDNSYNNIAMYLMYFDWALYLGVYLLIINLVNKDIKKELCICLSYLAVLLSLECIVKGIQVSDNFINFFDLYFTLGWGICNEAGIMLCVCLPFIFYNILKGDYKDRIINVIKIILAIVGILVTTSRATYIIAFIEIMAIIIYFIIKSKHKKIFIISLSSVTVITLILCLTLGIIDDLITYVFENGMGLNGRDKLWGKAISHFTKSPLTVIFGDGIVNEFELVTSDLDAEFEVGTYRMLVYHSTFFETLACNGIIGIGLLAWHFIQKYKLVLKKNDYSILLLISFICVDIYGMLDNTYHMYYYMIIIIIILGISEKNNNEESEIIEYEQ